MSMTLTRSQKAAAILVAMGKPSAGRLLKFFKQEELKSLIEGARKLQTIPQSDLEQIVAEFEDEFTEGVGQMDSADQMDEILSESLSHDELNSLMGRNEAFMPVFEAVDIWPEIEALEPARLGTFIAEEHVQTAALVLSKLAPQVAANVLLTLEKPQRSEIIQRMMTISSIPELATKIIENQLRARVLAASTGKDASAGQTRVASLLNEMDKDQVDEVLQDLEQAGTSDLAAVRSRLFSFEDIPMLAQKARLALFDGMSTEVLTMCLHQAPPAMVEAVLSSVGARSRRMIEGELARGSDGIAMADILKARKGVASTAIQMAREGAFDLPSAQNAA
jgi:flagellar motor switch protein FliG